MKQWLQNVNFSRYIEANPDVLLKIQQVPDKLSAIKCWDN